MADPEKEPHTNLPEIDDPEEPFIIVREIPPEELKINDGMRGGPGIFIPRVHSELYGHKGYAAAKGMDD